MSQSLFFYDLGSPYAYLAAERVDGLFATPPEWVPVLAGAIFKLTGKTPWPETRERGARMREIEERARARGLPPIRWPDPWPNDWLRALRAAVFAHELGRGKPFAREAFRLHFAHGRPLAEPETIAAAARCASLDPDETLAATDDPRVKLALRQRTERALALGVAGVPTLVVGGDVFWGDDRLEAAASDSSTSRPPRGARFELVLPRLEAARQRPVKDIPAFSKTASQPERQPREKRERECQQRPQPTSGSCRFDAEDAAEPERRRHPLELSSVAARIKKACRSSSSSSSFSSSSSSEASSWG